MTDDLLNDPALNPPGRADFRRVGKGVPLVRDPATGKMVRRRRSSSAGKVLDDESNLTDWKLRTVLVGAAQLPEVLAAVSVLDPEADKKVIRDHVEECIQAGRGNRRKVQGSAVHAMFDHVDLQHDWEPAPQFKPVVDAYVQMLGVYGLVAVDVEVPCVNDEFGLAGTLDRRYLTTRTLIAPDGTIIPIGSVLVGDTKTGLSLEFAGGTYVTQLAAYVDSVRYDVLTDERAVFDPPNYPDWALVVHAVPERATAELVWVDVEQGRQGLALAHQVWQWRRSTGLLTPAVPPLRSVPAAPQEPQEPAQEQEALPAAQEQQEPADGSGDPIVKEWLRGRVLAIKARSDVAAQQLARQWPTGVPGLKVEGHTAAQLDALEEVIDAVEADHSVPWGEPDPRVQASKERHPSATGRHWSDRWGNPREDDPTPVEQVELLSESLMHHPRRALLQEWAKAALLGSVGAPPYDRYALTMALAEFARLPEEWADGDVSTMLIGTLNAMGYSGGLNDLGRVKPEEAPTILSAAFAVASGTAMLMYDPEDNPVVRFNVIQQKG